MEVLVGIGEFEFSSCATVGDARRAIEHFLGTLGTDLGDDPTVLTAIPPSVLGSHPDAPETISEICRILLQVGDRTALRKVAALAPLLHDVERTVNASIRRYSLVKGLGQIAGGGTSNGVANVYRYLCDKEEREVPQQDRLLVNWGFVTAALSMGNVTLAARFAGAWSELASAGSHPAEANRAKRANDLLNGLLGHGLDESALPPLRDLLPEIAARFAAVFGDRASSGDAGSSTETDLPAFLGQGALPLFGAGEETGAPTGLWNLYRLVEKHAGPGGEATERADDLIRLADRAAELNLTVLLTTIEQKLREIAEPEFYKRVLRRLVGPHAADRVVLRWSATAPVTTTPEAVIWMCDVRGYSRYCEDAPAGTAHRLLSPLFSTLVKALEAIGGIVLEYVGDSMMVVFNIDPEVHTDWSAIADATTAALQELQSHGALRLMAGEPAPEIGVGIYAGTVSAGHLGGQTRGHIAVLGHPVNMAARLEGLTRDLPYPVAMPLEFAQRSLFGGERPHERAAFSARRFGRHRFKNIREPQAVVGLSPLIRYDVDFVPYGFVASPEKGLVYLDAGHACLPGIVDHHIEGAGADSTCELVIQRPELICAHLRDVPRHEIGFRVHETPDFDCAASLYAATELLEDRPRGSLLAELGAFASVIDQGREPFAGNLDDSLYGIFVAHQVLCNGESNRVPMDRVLLEAGLRVVDRALYLAEANGLTDRLPGIFSVEPSWFAEERRWLAEDRERYEEDVRRSTRYRAPVGGTGEVVEWLALDHPASVLFKTWVRADPRASAGAGFAHLFVDWSTKSKSRFVISVDPESPCHLRGLGPLLEEAETRKRAKIGDPRPTEPRRVPADNADPWYMGWGHRYTIVDSPAAGTVLSRDEVIAIHRAWQVKSTTVEGE